MFKRPLTAILTPKRLHVYPRIILITTWVVMGANLLLHQGWKGGLGQIIQTDFIVLYGAGLQYRTDISHLYDLASQEAVQQALMAPTIHPGINPFTYPPHVALAYSAWTVLPLVPAMLTWAVLSLGFLALAAYLLAWEMPAAIGAERFNLSELLVVLLSSFPFFLGWQVGQNHSLTLLLVSGILVCGQRKRWFSAGLLAGLLIYKPQFALGFLILWLVWGRWRALGGFALVAVAWSSLVVIQHGLKPFLDYLAISNHLLYLSVTGGFPSYLLTTGISLLAGLMPPAWLGVLGGISQVWFVLCSLLLGWVAFRTRKETLPGQLPAWLLVVIFPFIAAPYALSHDLLLLAPIFVLFYLYSRSQQVILIAALAYLGAFLLPVLGYPLNMALPALLPIGVLAAFIVTWRNQQARSTSAGP